MLISKALFSYYRKDNLMQQIMSTLIKNSGKEGKLNYLTLNCTQSICQ